MQLWLFLGLFNYYRKFIPNLATLIHPLKQLLREDVKWQWNSDCAQAFAEVKQVLLSSKVLVHYEPTLPITLARDAYTYGIGVVNFHSVRRHWTYNCICDLRLQPSLQGSETMHNWRRKHSPWILPLTVPPVPVWNEVYACHRPQASPRNPWTKEGYSIIGSNQIATLSFSPTCVHLQLQIQVHSCPWQCWWVIQTSPSNRHKGEFPKASVLLVSQMACLPITVYVVQIQQATRTDPCLNNV